MATVHHPMCYYVLMVNDSQHSVVHGSSDTHDDGVGMPSLHAEVGVANIFTMFVLESLVCLLDRPITRPAFLLAHPGIWI